jgi:enamine deaminase RidA (YjgF/YER057c/UK114 family)
MTLAVHVLNRGIWRVERLIDACSGAFGGSVYNIALTPMEREVPWVRGSSVGACSARRALAAGFSTVLRGAPQALAARDLLRLLASLIRTVVRNRVVGGVPPTHQRVAEGIVERKITNPWAWQDNFGFVQGLEVSGAQRTLYCAGQTSVDAEGAPAHAGDMRAQLGLALDNLETVLQQAGFTLGDVVRLTVYTTDVDQLFEAYDLAGARLASAACRPTMTWLGVSRLAFPELTVELEATAVR